MEQFILEARNVSKRFPGVLALNNVSMQLREREILGLIGENGAGKSTLLKILNGIYPKDTYQGEILLSEEPVAFQSERDALAKGIGYVPQEIDVMEDLTVAENIFVGQLKAGRDRTVNHKRLYERAEQYMKEINVDIDPAMNARFLSVGRRQYLMILRALAWNPKILILDEPSTSLSKDDVDTLFSVIRNLKEKGISIIYVTHKLEEISEITDRVTVLRDGVLVGTFEKGGYNADKLITMMVGRSITDMYPTRVPNIGEERLRVENLTVDHPKINNRTLIENVSFSIKAGEVVGFAGLVGAGRTETVSAIFGRYPLRTGKIFINGKNIKINNEATAIANGLGYATEDRKNDGLLMMADIKSNIVLSNLKAILNRLLISAKKENAAANTFMDRFRIKAPTIKSMVANLSGGNQQKVVLAKCLNTNPDILILDEPTKGIDVGTKHDIYVLINELAAMGIAIVMISSELPELLAMCDRFIVMSRGRVAGELTKAEATQESVMKLCFASA